MKLMNPNSLEAILSNLTKTTERLASFTTEKVAEADRHRAYASEAEVMALSAQSDAERAERIRARLEELLG